MADGVAELSKEVEELKKELEQKGEILDKDDEILENDPSDLTSEEGWVPPTEEIAGITIVKESPQVHSKGLELLRRRLEKNKGKRAKKSSFNPALELPQEILEDDRYLLKFLRIMKFDPKRTAQLLEHNWEFKVQVLQIPKKRIELSDINESVLRTGFLTLPDIKDKFGRRVVYIRPRFLDHSSTKREDYIKIAWYCMETVSEDEMTQKLGIVIINDTIDLTLANFDRGLISTILESIQKKLPIRIGAFLYLNPPTIFNMLWTIVQLFLSEKIRNRVRLLGTNYSALEEFFDKSQILVEHQGTFVHDHNEWVQSIHSAN